MSRRVNRRVGFRGFGGGYRAPSDTEIVAAIRARISTLTQLHLGGMGITLTSGAFSAWADQGPNGYNLSQGTAADRPGTVTIDGRVCPLFDDTDFLAGTAQLQQVISASAYHVVSIQRPDTVSLNAGNIYNNHVAGANAGLDWGGAYKNVSGTTPGFGAWHYDGAFKATGFSPVTTGTVYFLERKFDGATISAKAGTGSFQTVAAGNVSSGLTGATRIGRVTSGQGIVGAVCCQLVSNAVISASDLAYTKDLLRILFPSAVG